MVPNGVLEDATPGDLGINAIQQVTQPQAVMLYPNI